MDTHPVLKLLAGEEEPPFRMIQATGASLAANPELLADLMGQDLSNDLLALLETKAVLFNSILLELSAHITEQIDFSKRIAPFIRFLIHSTQNILDQGQYLGLLCTALRLCSANRSRWELVKEVAAQGRTLELLILSTEGSSRILQWFLTIREDGADASALIDLTQRAVSLVDTCSSDHGVSDVLNRWRKLEVLRQALHKAINSHNIPARAPGPSHSSKTNLKDTMFDHHTSLFFIDFGLPIPQSQRMYENHLDVLSGHETMLVLKRILASYPCALCRRTVQSDTALPKAPDNVGKTLYGYDKPNDSFFWNTKKLGEWQIVLSSQAYQTFRSIKGSFKTREALSMKLKRLAAGYLSWRIASSREAPRIPLQIAKGRADTDFLCQIDLAPGPEPNMEQQVIKIWAIGSQGTFDTIVEDVVRFQKGRSQNHVDECLQMGPVFRGKRNPMSYPRPVKPQFLRGPADLDIRVIDQDFIDTFNKTFTVTEDMLQSIVHQDLAAEYPFDMSEIEMEIIQHSERPTLIMGRSGTGKTACLVFKMVYKHCAMLSVSPENRARQVLLTRSETLADKLALYSARLIRTLSKTPTTLKRPDQSHQSDQLTLLDLDLGDFPFVCTYDRFLVMLKNAMDLLKPMPSTGVFKTDARADLVDFKAFRYRYWPHIPPDLRKNLSADLVFSEIMGTIKGSIHACTAFRSLTALEYQALSARVAPTFPSSDDRSKVFRIFQRYEKLKAEADETDSIDFVISLLRRLREDHHMKSQLVTCFHDFYVDEVQDLRCVDISLLLTLGNDPRGFHFGGDTAQGISQDSTFRFQDVKALFHAHFGPRSTAVGQEDLAQPFLFTLSRNYRSHQGILSLASSVIELLFTNFPDTVDRLGPEIGTLAGPVPDLFLGCDRSILINRTSGELASTHEVLFGAEQVILTRDEEQKSKLVHSIGEAALVLTILQAKGMEFEDVVLFNFFSSTPDSVGWRSIQRSTMDEPSKFDAIKHAALCFELKHLYVAVTRARIRFIMIEESEDNARPFIDLMTLRSALPLVEVTSATSPKFAEKIQILKPTGSGDPHRWAAHGEEFMVRGDFAVAALCFRRASHPLKAKIAEAHLREIEGVELEAKGEGAASRVKFEEALSTFLEMNLIFESVKLLIRLKRLVDAAELWYQSGQFDEAALLFEKAFNYQRASNSWHKNGDFEKAITCLRSGKLNHEMIAYLTENKAKIDDRDFIRHQRVVKFLLKQQKISPDYRILAVRLVGSIREQEAFYLEYEMLENLIELYEEQRLSSKLLLLRLQLGHFREAFDLASSMSCRGSSVIGKAQSSRLTSIVWTDYIVSNSSPLFNNIVGTEGDQSWQLASKILRAWDSSSSEKVILGIDNDPIIREYLCLYVTIHMEQVISTINLPGIPYDLFHHALMEIKTQGTEPSGPFGAAVLLLCGVHRDFSSSQQYTLRPWSPLRTGSFVDNGNSLPETALRWTYDELSSAIIRGNELTKDFFRVKWPTRCSFLQVKGFCGNRSKTSGCPYLHETVTSSSMADFLHDILTITTILCEMTSLYNQRILPDTISAAFLGTRRHWLERLIAALSFVSAFEQDTLVLNEFRRKLSTEKSFRTVASILEDHLLYRVRTEWNTRASLGYIFEQLDLAAYLGGTVMRSLIRRTAAPLRRQDPVTCAALAMLDRLQAHITSGNPIGFLDSLKDYLRGPEGIMKLPWKAFEVFHCHTSKFEEIALYLLLQISQSSIMVPRSWVDLHLPNILTRNSLVTVLNFQQRSIYRDALVILLDAFVELLHFIDASLQDGNKKKFQLCGRDYPSRILLQQRNCELLSIIMVNLLAVRVLCPPDIKTHWEAVVQVLKLPTTKDNPLNHKVGNEIELRNKLLISHGRYEGKNPLIILNILDSMSQHSFTAFQKTNGLANEYLATLRKGVISKEVPGRETHVGAATEVSSEQVLADTKAAQRIWIFWKKHSPRLRARQAFASTLHGRLISKIGSLSKSCSLEMRCILFRYGSEVFPLLDSLDSSIGVLRKRALSQLDTAGVESSEGLDLVLESTTGLGEALGLHHERLSDESLHSLIQAEDSGGLKEFLEVEHRLMSDDKSSVATLNEILDGMAGE